MSDALLLAKLEEAESRATQKQAELDRARAELHSIMLALPAEFGITFTGDYAAYTRAIVEQLQREPIIPAPLAGYEHLRAGKTAHGDLFWHRDAERAGWHHVHGEGIEVAEYTAVIRKKPYTDAQLRDHQGSCAANVNFGERYPRGWHPDDEKRG